MKREISAKGAFFKKRILPVFLLICVAVLPAIFYFDSGNIFETALSAGIYSDNTTGIANNFQEEIDQQKTMMNINIKESLAAQGLDESDIAMNRAGRMSEKQIARQMDVRKGGKFIWLLAVSIIVLCVGFGVWNFMKSGNIGIVIFMSILGLVFAALPLGIYYAFRFADPSKVAACKVVEIENAEVGGFLPSSNRGIYAISLNHQRYSGFASELSATHLGKRVNAYVIPEYRIVVALEPVS